MRTRLQVLLVTVPMACANVNAQIPNGSFEIWEDMGGYQDPADWSSWNYLTHPFGYLTCTQGSPGYSGSYYMHLETPYSTDAWDLGLSPNDLGAAACTGIASASVPSIGQAFGFPFTQRPAYITGAVRYNTTMRLLGVQLSRWNTAMQYRQQILSDGVELFVGTQPDWTPFQEGLYYENDLVPDTAWILIVLEGNTTPDEYFDVDALAFEGQVGLDEAEADTGPLSVFPSPCTSTLHIDMRDPHTTMISVLDLGGRVVMSPGLWLGQSLDVSALSPGSYSIQAIRADGSFIQSRFVKQ